MQLTLPAPAPHQGMQTRISGRDVPGTESLSLTGRRGRTLGYWTGAEVKSGGSSSPMGCLELPFSRAKGARPYAFYPGSLQAREAVN